MSTLSALAMLRWRGVFLCASVAAFGALYATACTRPPDERDAGPALEETPDSAPCGTASTAKTLSLSQNGAVVADNAQVRTTTGSSGQGGDAQFFMIRVHLEGVRSDQSALTQLKVTFKDDQGAVIAEDTAGSLKCYSGILRTTTRALRVGRDTFSLTTGQVEMSAQVDGVEVKCTQPIRY